MSAMSSPPAGWYPAPERDGAEQWFDGIEWQPRFQPLGTDAEESKWRPKTRTGPVLWPGSGL